MLVHSDYNYTNIRGGTGPLVSSAGCPTPSAPSVARMRTRRSGGRQPVCGAGLPGRLCLVLWWAVLRHRPWDERRARPAGEQTHCALAAAMCRSAPHARALFWPRCVSAECSGTCGDMKE